MRIGIFTDSYYPHISGVATSIEMLKESLEHMGHTVYIVAPNLDDTKFVYDKKKKLILLPGVKIGLYKLRLAEIYSSKAMKIIKNEWKLDIVHTQTEFSIGYFGRTVAKKMNIPRVHTYHTLYEDYVYYLFGGHFTGFTKKLAVKVTKYYCDNKCDGLIVPTDKIKKLFNNKYNITRGISVIPTGIDIKKFYKSNGMKKKAKEIREKYGIKDDEFIIGSVGRVAAEKSFDKIIQNMVKLSRINNKIKFMLVGGGPDLENIKTLTKELGVEDNVIFTDLIDYNEIPAYYNALDVLVSYSTTETQGLTIIEGLAASLPAVCIDDTSFRAMVKDGYNGYLFHQDEEFRKCILDLMSDKELYQTMSMNAKNSTYEYSKEVFGSRLLEVYYRAIKNKRDGKTSE